MQGTATNEGIERMQTLPLNDVTLVGARIYSYDFTDKADGRQIVGKKHYAYVVEAEPLSQPQEVEVNEAQYMRLQAHGFGVLLNVTCEVKAKNNRVVMIAEDIVDASTGELLRAVS